jgi:hypothetical protein
MNSREVHKIWIEQCEGRSLCGKVQRKVSNGIADWPPPDHLGIGRKSRQFLPAQAS